MTDIYPQDSVKVGPFLFEFLADGDDPRPGTGAVRLSTDSGYFTTTSVGVSRDEWKRFRRKVDKKK
jgi:hypothetical protein